jgi:hypothetical protein
LHSAISEQTNYKTGKYGQMHLEYIEHHRQGRYNTLLIEARLNTYLHEIDVNAHSILTGSADLICDT